MLPRITNLNLELKMVGFELQRHISRTQQHFTCMDLTMKVHLEEFLKNGLKMVK